MAICLVERLTTRSSTVSYSFAEETIAINTDFVVGVTPYKPSESETQRRGWPKDGIVLKVTMAYPLLGSAEVLVITTSLEDFVLNKLRCHA
jgi:hypothetical protein